MRLHVGEEPLARRPRTIADLHHAIQQGLEETVEHRSVERLFVAEIVVKQRLVDASRFGDGIDARAGQSFLRKLHQRRLQDGLAAGSRLAAAAARRYRMGWLDLHLIN